MGPGNERGAGNELGARRAEQFPHLGNYTLTPGSNGVDLVFFVARLYVNIDDLSY